MTTQKTLGDLLKDVKKSIIDEVDKKDPVVSLDKNEDGLVITKSSGEQFTIDLSHFNADMSGIVKGEKGDTGERGERGLTIKGDRGEAGRAGNSITDIKFDQRGHLIITTDDKKYDLGLLRSGGGTTIIKQGSGEGTGEVDLTGDITGTTNINGVTTTTLQASDNVLSIIAGAPTYAYPEITELSIDFPANKYEIGDVIPTGAYSVDFSFINPDNMQGDSFTLIDLNRSGAQLSSSITQSSNTFNIASGTGLNEVGYYQYELYNRNNKDELFSTIYEIPFVDKFHYAESDQDTLNPLEITATEDFLSEVERPEYTDFAFSEGSGSYKWILIPERFGDDYSFIDAATGIQVLMESGNDLDLTNVHNITTTYKTYRSLNAFAGEITIRVY